MLILAVCALSLCDTMHNASSFVLLINRAVIIIWANWAFAEGAQVERGAQKIHCSSSKDDF